MTALTPRTRRLLSDARGASFTPEIQALTAADRPRLEGQLSEGSWRSRAPCLAAIRALADERRAVLIASPEQAPEIQHLAHHQEVALGPLAASVRERRAELLVLCGHPEAIRDLLVAFPDLPLVLPTPCPYHGRITLRRLLDAIDHEAPQIRAAHAHTTTLVPSFRAAS